MQLAEGKESKIGSSASNMRALKWNPDLAKVAQHWAEQCINGHEDPQTKWVCVCT